jgi:hypothetical protein
MALVIGSVAGGAGAFRDGEAEDSEKALIALEHAAFCEVRLGVSTAVPAKPLPQGRRSAQPVDAAEQGIRILRGDEHAAIPTVHLACRFAAVANGGHYGSPGRHVGKQLRGDHGILDRGTLVQKEGIGGRIHLRDGFWGLERQNADVGQAVTQNFLLESRALFAFAHEKPEEVGILGSEKHANGER